MSSKHGSIGSNPVGYCKIKDNIITYNLNKISKILK